MMLRLSISESNNRIIFRPIEKDENLAKSIFSSLKKTGNLVLNAEFNIEDKSSPSTEQMHLYKGSLSYICSHISDVKKKYTKEELNKEVKEKFCEAMLDEGIDLYEYIAVEIDGEFHKARVPISFTKKNLTKSIYSKFLDFFKRYCESNFGIDPYEDSKERQYKLRQTGPLQSSKMDSNNLSY